MKDMLKKFNTTETWIDVETLANLKGISKRAIRLSFNSKNSNYETKIENGKGGHLYKIRLSSIEEDLQIKYIHEYYDTLSEKYIFNKNAIKYSNQDRLQIKNLYLKASRKVLNNSYKQFYHLHISEEIFKANKSFDEIYLELQNLLV